MQGNRVHESVGRLTRLNEKLKKLLAQEQAPDPNIQRFIKDPEYLLKGNPMHPEHDEFGFRNPDMPKQVDILAVGDSMTYGHKVPAEKSWPVVLAEQSGRSVYNAGMNAWGAVQYAMTLERMLCLAPQTVLVNLYLGNDIYESFICAKSSTAPFAASLRRPEYETLPFPDFSGHFNSMAELERRKADPQFADEEAALASMRGQGFADINYTRIEDSEFYCADRLHYISENLDHPIVQAGLEIFTAALVRMRDAVRNYGSTLHLVIQPTREYLVYKRLNEAQVDDPDGVIQAGEMEERMLARIKAVCRDNFVQFTDLSDVLAAYLGKRIFIQNNFDGHYSERGHKLVALHLKDTVLPRLDRSFKSDMYTIF